jgi:hypothetical protein
LSITAELVLKAGQMKRLADEMSTLLSVKKNWELEDFMVG